MRRRHWEDMEAKQVWQWAQHHALLRALLYHIPNGGKRNRVGAALLKSMGARAGVSDWHLPLPRGPYCGLWVEFKASRPRSAAVTADQARWGERMTDAGHAFYAARGFDQAKAVFTWYLSLPAPDMVAPPVPAIESLLNVQHNTDPQGVDT